MKHTDYTLFSFAKNTGGLNTRDTLANQDINTASAIQNVEYNSRGGMRERRGCVRLTSAPLSDLICVGLADIKTTNNLRDNVGVFGDQIYKMDQMDGNWDKITGTVSLTSGANNYISFATGLDTLIGANGVDAPWKYTQSGDAAALSISQFTVSKFVRYWKNRLIHFVTTESGNLLSTRIRWSNPSTIETYQSANNLDINNKDGSEISGVGNLFDSLYIFKDSYTNGISELVFLGGDAITFTYSTYNEVGAISNGSIVKIDIPNVGPGLMYWGVDNKIRLFDGTKSYALSDRIQPTLDTLNISRNKHIQAVNFYSLNQVWFFVSDGSSTTHNKIIVYDYLNNAFLIHKSIDYNIGQVLIDSNEAPKLITGGYTGLAYTQNTGNNDDNGAIVSFYKSAWLDFGKSILSKTVRWVMLFLADLGDYNLSVKWGFNFSDAPFSSKDVNLASSDLTFPFTFPITLGGESVKIKQIEMVGNNNTKYFRIEFGNSNLNEPWTVYRYDLMVKYGGIKE